MNSDYRTTQMNNLNPQNCNQCQRNHNRSSSLDIILLIAVFFFGGSIGLIIGSFFPNVLSIAISNAIIFFLMIVILVIVKYFHFDCRS